MTNEENDQRAAHEWMLTNTEAALSGGTKAEKALVELLRLTRIDEQERIGRLLHEAAKANLRANEGRTEMSKDGLFRGELESLINRYSMENGSNTPDFILADYLHMCLMTFDATVMKREKWYGRVPREAGNGPAPDPSAG